jgi:hypothetical protein
MLHVGVNPSPAAHILTMRGSTIWSVAPARLGPVPLDPHPVKNPNSPGFPSTAEEAIAFARFIQAARSERTPWRKIAEQLAISRIEAIRLAYSLDDVLTEIRDAAQASKPLAS